MRLGRSNVDALGRSLTAKQFREWEHYAALEPFNEERQDYRIASIVAMLYNINRGKDVEALDLDGARVKFGEQEKKEPSWQMQIAIAKSMAALANALADDGQKVIDK